MSNRRTPTTSPLTPDDLDDDKDIDLYPPPRLGQDMDGCIKSARILLTSARAFRVFTSQERPPCTYTG